MIKTAALAYSGFLGGAASDGGEDIAVDLKGNAYVTGDTVSSPDTFPAVGGPDPSYNEDTDASWQRWPPTASSSTQATSAGRDSISGEASPWTGPATRM